MKRSIRTAAAVLVATAGLAAVTVAAPPGMAGTGLERSTLGREARIARVLHRVELTVTFDQTPIRDVVKHLQLVLGIPIRASLDDRLDGIDPETPITLVAEVEPALVVLEDILDQCDELAACSWQIRRGRLEIGTKERLARHRELRVYSVDELLVAIPQFDNAPDLDLDAALNQGSTGGGNGGFGGTGSGGGGGGGSGSGSIISPPDAEPPRPSGRQQATDLIKLIQSLIEPDAWQDNGGDWASIQYHQGVLIVHAPVFIHRRLR